MNEETLELEHQGPCEPGIHASDSLQVAATSATGPLTPVAPSCRSSSATIQVSFRGVRVARRGSVCGKDLLAGDSSAMGPQTPKGPVEVARAARMGT
jgi:hypothetical protein